MVIKTSSEIRSLVSALSSNDGLRREAAIARLAVAGTRATDRLMVAYRAATESRTRVGILRALEAIADPRGLTLVSEVLLDKEGGDPAVAAAGALKPLLESRDAATAAAALDVLVEAALDPSRERRVRLAAYTALQDIPSPMLEQITKAFDVDVRHSAREQGVQEAMFADAVDGRLPDDPNELRAAIVARGSTAALGSLQKLIDVIRAREGATADPALRAAWQQARGAAHQALAFRASRIAVYDLRETIETTDAPLPPSFLAAMRAVGDASCVESLAAALARAPEGDLWWRHQLASALRGIATREGMTRRHASVKRALARWPQAAAMFPARRDVSPSHQPTKD